MFYEDLIKQAEELLTKDPEAAAEIYRKAAKESTGRGEAYYGLGRAYATLGKASRASSTFPRAA